MLSCTSEYFPKDLDIGESIYVVNGILYPDSTAKIYISNSQVYNAPNMQPIEPLDVRLRWEGENQEGSEQLTRVDSMYVSEARMKTGLKYHLEINTPDGTKVFCGIDILSLSDAKNFIYNFRDKFAIREMTKVMKRFENEKLQRYHFVIEKSPGLKAYIQNSLEYSEEQPEKDHKLKLWIDRNIQEFNIHTLIRRRAGLQLSEGENMFGFKRPYTDYSLSLWKQHINPISKEIDLQIET
ncbi:hypothetical protein EL17_00045 [Anditalea andensis]|uniref:Uncharacterized protein n=1 Tax=Anditalea andensis TaxID=1048983 RepID=A0A074L410_9BACT|nr:hypothetical protein EL17_00045 [Anditalea andensis]